MIRHRSLAVQILLLLTIGCGGAEKDADTAVTVRLPPAEGAAAGAQEGLSRPGSLGVNRASDPHANLDSAPADPVRSSRYTSLDPASCDLLEGNASKNLSHRRCAGPAGYALETMQGDARQELAIISPDGSRSELNLPAPVAGATFGKLAEWRGPRSGQLRALIVRVSNASEPRGPRDLGNLIVARLMRPACVVAVVPPGARQNE
jgi:hypothetical protein